MLTARATRLRELGLFAAAALVPSIAIGALGLRAVANEEAGARREVVVALEAAAARTSGAIELSIAQAAREVGRVSASPDADAEARAVAAFAPRFADVVVLDRAHNLVVPRGESPHARAPEGCYDAADRLATSREASARDAARALVLEKCEDAAREHRFIWPIVAIDACRRGHCEGDRLAAWLESHAGALGGAERDATLADVQSLELAPTVRARALAALSASASRKDTIDLALHEPAVAAALRGKPDASGVITWAAGRSAGALHVFDDGSAVGFVVHARALTEALATGVIELPKGFGGEVVEGAPDARGGSKRDRHGELLEARAEIAPLLAVRVAPIDPRAITRHAERSRALLSAIAIGTTLAAFAVATLLFVRMRAARRSSELRTDFVSAVSHELRTPIASVRMLAELLEEDRVEPEERAEVHEALAREARRLGETVDRLLGFSRMEAGRYVIERREARVAAPVLASIGTFEERHPGLVVEREIDANATAEIDEGQVRLAVDNLLANAAKYAANGAPYRVTVAEEQNGIRVAVADHGPGVAPRDRSRIFQPFERADDRLSRATEGSGIGLSLVRHVAHAHGGEARVEPTPGGGATFILWLPRKRA